MHEALDYKLFPIIARLEQNFKLTDKGSTPIVSMLSKKFKEHWKRINIIH